MQPAAFGTAYDHLADRWLDDRFNAQDGMAAHRHALAFLSPESGGRALNAGCGCNTRFNRLCGEHGPEVDGVDISERMVARARAADPNARIHHADLCTWQAPHSYHFISAWDSIWHVRLDHQRELMPKPLGLLEVGGVMVFSAGGLDGPSEHVDSTMGPTVCYATLGIRGILRVIDEAGCALRHPESDQLPHSHLVVIAQRLTRAQES
jgi:predicted TPR repeat methyltransferase